MAHFQGQRQEVRHRQAGPEAPRPDGHQGRPAKEDGGRRRPLQQGAQELHLAEDAPPVAAIAAEADIFQGLLAGEDVVAGVVVDVELAGVVVVVHGLVHVDGHAADQVDELAETRVVHVEDHPGLEGRSRHPEPLG